MATTHQFIFTDEQTAKNFVRTATLQYEVPVLRYHHVVLVVMLEDQMQSIYDMAHNFGGWIE